MHVIEQYKQERNGLDVGDDIPRYAQHGWEGIPKDDIERLKWWGVFLRKQSEGEPGFFMMRIRIANGIATSAQLRTIAGITAELGRGVADVTTRQQLQTRWIRIDDVPEAIDRLRSVGLVTLQTGMDNIRNVVGCPLAGLHDAELFDASSVAGEFTDMFVGDRRFTNLPRKFNVTITGCRLNCTHPETQDVGLVPAVSRRTGQPGFNVLVGGKVGSGGYTIAQPLNVFVAPDLAAELCAAITLVFSDNGSREHRNKARLAFLLEDWGIDRFRAEVADRFGGPIEAAGTDDRLLEHRDHLGVTTQTDRTKRAVGVVIPSGRTDGDDLAELARLADVYGTSEMRLTIDQNAILVNVPEDRVDDLLHEPLLQRLRPDAPRHLRRLVTCTGSDYCNLAQINTKPRALEIAEAVAADMRSALTVHWSGCQAGCGNHPVADIGLMGKNVRVGGEVVEGVDVFVGGSSGPRAAEAMKILSDVPCDELEPIMRGLVRYGALDAIRERLFSLRRLPVSAAPTAELPSIPTSNGSGTVVLSRGDLTETQGKLVRIEGEDVAVFRTNGCVHAIQNMCPHAESPLVDGTVDGHAVICAEHGYRFDLRTGACANDPSLRAKVFAVTAVDDDHIEVGPGTDDQRKEN